MSSDDLFSRLFELFDQSGPINWKLAAEMMRHITDDRTPVEPDLAEEYRELARLAEHRLTTALEIPVHSADLLALDRREWAERNLEGYGYLGVAIDLRGQLPMGQLTPSLLGMQIGSMVGVMASDALASFDTGFPPDRAFSLSVVVPAVEDFASATGLDAHSVRLWTVTSELVFRSLTGPPWVVDRLTNAVNNFGDSIEIDPSIFEEMQTGFDPATMSGMLEGSIGETDERAELETLSASLYGRTMWVTRRLLADLIPNVDELIERRLALRSSPETVAVSLRPLPSSMMEKGAAFWEEVARRYGDDAVGASHQETERLPHVDELDDPVAWAARVLLDDLDLGDMGE
ncbi:MAG: hypothetical protein GEU79_03845 [Acidimicrobiia bacterium]|nr:hypothetical protein [Acidimicrobiia bacterium]